MCSIITHLIHRITRFVQIFQQITTCCRLIFIAMVISLLFLSIFFDDVEKEKLFRIQPSDRSFFHTIHHTFT